MLVYINCPKCGEGHEYNIEDTIGYIDCKNCEKELYFEVCIKVLKLLCND